MTLQLEITGIAFGGHGVARHEGKVYFVRGAVPGDIVHAEIINETPRYSDALASTFVRRSELRGEAPCPSAGICGGCQWQDIPYETQLGWKTEFLRTALKKIAKLDIPLDQVTVYPSPEVFHYRNRILLRVHVSSSGSISCGYFKRASRELVPTNTCKIADPFIDQFIASFNGSNLPDAAGEKWRMEVQVVHDEHSQKKLLITVHPSNSPITQQQQAALKHLQKLPGVAWAGYVAETRSAPAFLFDQQGFMHSLGTNQINFHTQPGQFQQVNISNNHVLREITRRMVEELKPKRILDLFCGSGNLSLPLLQEGRYVEGCESNRNAIAIAKNQSAQLIAKQGGRATYLANDANKHLKQLLSGKQHFDLVLLDPPRQGMRDGTAALKSLAPHDIIYISCDPNTLCRDLATLCQDGTYKIKEIAALDFFPHTYHIETITHLTRLKN